MLVCYLLVTLPLMHQDDACRECTVNLLQCRWFVESWSIHRNPYFSTKLAFFGLPASLLRRGDKPGTVPDMSAKERVIMAVRSSSRVHCSLHGCPVICLFGWVGLS